MIEQIQALRFDIEEVGKHVKASKKRFTWELALKDKHHSIVLDFSFISGKVKITVDRKILLENELPSNVSFQYPFTLDGFALNVIQQGETFELRVNNKVFTHLYNQQKTNTEFRKYEEEVKDIKVDQRQFEKGDKKISLNIGAFGGMKKKQKKEGGGGGGWDGGAMSFPSYFQGTTQSTETEEKEQQKQIPAHKNNLLDDDSQPETVHSNQQESILDFSLPSSPATLPPFDFNLPQQTAESTHPPAQNSIFEVTNPIPQKDQFNTMQNMFQTMKLTDNIGSIDFFADSQPVSQPVQQPVQQQISFQSISQPISVPTQQQPSINTIQNPSDFNTMQMMFATNSQGLSFPPSQPNLGFTLGQTTSTVQTPTSTSTSPATDQLNSMMNKQQPSFASNSHQQFATGMGVYGQYNGLGDLGSLGGINPQMFATTSNSKINEANLGFSKKTSQPQPQPQLSFTKKVQSSDSNLNAVFESKPTPITQNQPITLNTTLPTSIQAPVNATSADLTNLDVNDFNTMQKLFQTNSIQFNPNPPQGTSSISSPPFNLATAPTTAPTTNNIQFDLFANNSHPVSMNSMSGFPANKQTDINPASFGTMQPGLSSQGLDFLNLSKPNPTATKPPTDSSSLL